MSAMKTSRRDVIKWGAVAPAIAGISSASLASAPQNVGVLDAMLVDTRFDAHAGIDKTGVRQLRFSGDVTWIWYNELDAKWRKRGFTLAGITGSDALFVLENLAQQQGRRVIRRQQLAPKDARGIAPISWVIAPHHKSVMP